MKFPQPFLEQFQEKEEMEQQTKPLLFLAVSLFKKPWRLFSPHVLVWKN